MLDALSRALQLSRQVASAAVVTDAKDQKAVDFYQLYGFIQLQTKHRLFLSMSTIAALSINSFANSGGLFTRLVETRGSIVKTSKYALSAQPQHSALGAHIQPHVCLHAEDVLRS